MVDKPATSRNRSLSTSSTALSKPSSELGDLTLTSPSTGRIYEKGSPTKVGQSLSEQAKPSTTQVMAALSKFTTPGSSHNPIVLIEDSPQARVSRKNKEHSKAEPHRFQDRHRKLYTYNAPRLALVSKPANGSTFTGDPGHDMYRMRTAKMALPVWQMGEPQHVRPDLPFEMQYPMSAQYLVSQQSAAHPLTRPAIQYFAPPPLTHPQHMVPHSLNEEQIRRRAVQYVREYSRSSSCKRKMVEDRDETSESESEEVHQDNTIPTRKSHLTQIPIGSIRPKSSPVTVLPDPHFQLTPLIDQASLLTSLLRVYPQSADQKGLREDIAMLAPIQNQHLADWLNFEAGQSPKLGNPHTPHVSRSPASSPKKAFTHRLTNSELAEAEKKRKHDDEIRHLLSADAKHWQDGSGLGVADVYAETRPSTPPSVLDTQDDGEAKTAAVSASSPVRCTVNAPVPLSSQNGTLPAPTVKVHPAAEVNGERASNPRSESATTTSSPPTRSGARSFMTPSPRVARTASSPAARTSGGKRMAAAGFRTE